MEKGAKIKLTTDDAFKEKCTKDVVWLDYKNITKVIVPGKRIFIDDGLISVVATEIGKLNYLALLYFNGPGFYFTKFW